jgi:hypothetical protein
MRGLEVALTSPSSNDGRKRFISCTSVLLLAAERDQFIARGIR